MNITPLTIYLWQLADRVINVSMPIIGVTAILAFVFFGIGSDMSGTTQKNLIRAGVASIVACLLSVVIYTITPSSNTIAMMVVIPRISESKVIQQDVPDIYNAAVEAIKNQLKK